LRTKVVLLVTTLLLAAACGSDGGEEAGEQEAPASVTVTVYAPNSLKRVMPEVVADFEEQNPGVKVELTVERTEELAERIAAGDTPDVYIGSSRQIDQLKANDPGVSAQFFGVDVMSIIVPEGNPAGVTDLGAFGDREVRSAICADDTPCGLAARAVLDSAGITPTPEVVGDGWLPVLKAVEKGEVDAGLLNSTEYGLGKVDVVPLAPGQEREVRYAVVVMSDAAPAAAFADWLVSDEAVDTLRAQGLEDARQVPATSPAAGPASTAPPVSRAPGAPLPSETGASE